MRLVYGFWLSTLVWLGGLSSCSRESLETPVFEGLEARAQRLAQEMIVLDTHVDVPYRLMQKMEDISVATQGGDFDYPRAKAGGLNAAFMSIYVPASYQETGGARDYADQLIDLVEKFETDWPEKFAIARSPHEVRTLFEEGKIALPLGMENGAPIEGELSNLSHFYERGIRYITLTHSENNHICDSSFAADRKWNGLSPFGRQVVEEMNRLGIMVDVSHISDQAFYQVMELSKAPVIASHSSCRKFTPGLERNMDDDMIRRLGEEGGVIQINFGSGFLIEAATQQALNMFAELGAYLATHNLTQQDPEAQEFMERYQAENPTIYADVTDVVAHIEHAVSLVGIDHVGLGSDFDGVGDSLPTGLKDVSQYPNLIQELLKKGYSEEDLEKLLGGNLLRVWSEAERVAAEIQAQGNG